MKSISLATICCLFFLTLPLPQTSAAEKEANRTRFYIATPEGKNPKPFFFSEDYYNTGSPTFSPDGQKLAFDGWKSQEGENFSDAHIMVVNADGTDFKVLGPGAMPSWSPEGDRIAFTQSAPAGVAIMDADGSNREMIEPGGWGAQWSPDGKKIAYRFYTSRRPNIRVYDLIEDTKTDLFPEGESPYSNLYWNMAWSPDSNWLCFNGRKISGRVNDVATINVGGMKQGYKVHYTDKNAPYSDFAWSPQGDMIVFCPKKTPRQLYKFNPADNKAPKPINIKLDGYINGDVCFTPDGQQLLFNRRDKAP
ncbi:translocation protein TolB [Gimesia panareensis]|uniref:Translocation protein TolB n=1 Tax=Gimesia panareensis TaxID=2527978 RepID=A0A518FXN0_9PLAN|nr:PD40 domain-containing protein [Gimesia panareensis]QDV21138.1 translocation protein TolB [Gimesia panareensis]